MCAASSPLSTRSIVSATGVELLITFAPTASYDGRLWTSAADRTNVVCSLPTAAATAMANIGASLATSSEFFIKGQGPLPECAQPTGSCDPPTTACWRMSRGTRHAVAES
jgi:hypothetical protein